MQRSRAGMVILAASIAYLAVYYSNAFSGPDFQAAREVTAIFAWLNTIGLGFFIVVDPYLTRRASRTRIAVTLKPNEVLLDGVSYRGDFSSEAALIARPKALADLLLGAVNERLPGRWIALKPAAEVMLPGAGLSELERICLDDILRELFVDYRLS